MTTFGFTSGDPSHLLAGANASMADMQGPLVDIRTFLNGNISDVNLSSSAAINENKLATGSSGLAKGAFSAYRNAVLSLTGGSTVVFDAEEFDVSGWFDTTTGAYTPQVPGYYRLSASVYSGSAMTADFYWKIRLQKNGVDFKQGQVVFQRGVVDTTSSVGSWLVAANGTTDAFRIVLYHGAGIAVSVAAGVVGTYFQGELVGRV